MYFSNDSSNFVLLDNIVKDIILDIRYYSTFNFVGERIDGYHEPLAIISKEAAFQIKKINDELKKQNYILKVYDAYRPYDAVKHFVKWAKDIDDIKMKEYFYSDVDKKLLFDLGYISDSSSHTRGSSIDLTIFDLNNNEDLDMGSSFDYFGIISHYDYPNLTLKQKKES